MKKVLTYFSLLVSILLIVGCEKEDFQPIIYDSTEKNLVGTWEITIFKFREINQCSDSTLGWEWCEDKPLCNITHFEYNLNGNQLIIGNDIWNITTSFANTLVLSNSRGTQYRELVLEK